MSDKITQKKLKDCLSYNSETGYFIWKKSKGTAMSGSKAGYKKDGYIYIMVDRVKYLAHRLAWLYIHGYFPENFIDHINRERNDNRICNLREATQQCNLRNAKIRSSNKSGVTGVSFRKESSNWSAQIGVNWEKIHIGDYKKISDAVEARWKAEVKYDFPNCCTTSTAYNYLKDNNLLPEGE